MARFSAGTKTSAGSTTLPLISIYSSASVGGWLREVGLFNTTTTNADYKLVRLTSQGAPGTALTAAHHDDISAAGSLTPFSTHSVSCTLGNDLGYRCSLGAAVGSAVVFTFGDKGIHIPAGTANGIGVIVENGTGQILQAYLVWDE